MIPFIVVYLVFLCLYFYTRPSGNIKYRAINKYIMATMYLVYAFIMFKNYELLSYQVVLLIALFFAYLGDIFLVFNLNRGGDFFLCGNVCFVLYYALAFVANGLQFANFYWILIVWAVIFGTFVFLSNKFPNVIRLNKMKFAMTFYLSSIMMHGCFGLGAMILLPTTQFIVMGLGSVMFMISDFILTIDKFVFRNNKWIVRANSLFYFGGLLLIVLSMGL